MPDAKARHADLQRLIDLSPAVHYVAKASGDYGATYVSAGVQAQLGYTADQFMQDPAFWVNHVHPDDRPRVFADLESQFVNDQQAHEYRFLHADGAWRWMEDRLTLVRDESGNPSEIIGSWLDITQRKQAENTIKEMLARLEALAVAAFDGFAIVEDGAYVEVSDRFASKLGYEPEELLGKPVSLTSAPSSLQIISRNIQSGGHTAYEAVIQRKDGSTFPAEVRGAPIVHRGRAARIGAFRDISEREALRRRIIGIRERERQNIARDLHDGVGQTLTGVSLGLVALRQKLEQEGSANLESLRELTLLVQKTIAETRLMARTLTPSIGPDGFSSALKTLAAEISEHTSVALRVCCPRDMAFGDDETVMHLYRLVQEGVNNAIRHANAKNIEVLCRREGGTVHVEVLDDGKGIPPEGDRGSGIGLRHMYERAQLMGGDLQITNRSEGGTRVHCYYPSPEEVPEVEPQTNQVLA